MWQGAAVHEGMSQLPEHGVEGAFEAIDQYAAAHPVLGEDEHHKRDELVARTRAMVRAAQKVWG